MLKYIGLLIFALICSLIYKTVINRRVRKVKKEFEQYKTQCLKEANEKMINNSGDYIDTWDLTGAKAREK